MTRYFSFLLISILATGCILTPTKEYVDVPYPVSCVSWEPTREQEKYNLLSGKEPLWEQVRALLLDRESDRLFIEGQNAVIEGCK